MNSPTVPPPNPGPTRASAERRVIDHVNASLKRRHAAERRFRALGMAAVALGLLFVAVLFLDIVAKGYTAFEQTYIQLPIAFDPEVIDPDGSRNSETLADADYMVLIDNALMARFPNVTERSEQFALSAIVSVGAPYQLQRMVLADPGLIGKTRPVWLLADDLVDMFAKGRVNRDLPESTGNWTTRP